MADTPGRRRAVAPYDVRAVERKWQARWAEARCFEAAPADAPGPRFFNFDGGPFPNGALHIGHARTFTLGDAMARYQRMRGRNVLYCFEFDAFGLPNEFAAQERGQDPEELTRANIAVMREQMVRLGLSYDFRHVHVTCDPRYYRWTQWLFLRLHDAGLVYRGAAELNWCGSCGTTLAHMQVVEGRCWRCDTPVEQRELTQWFVRLSRYSAVLSDSLAGLEGWSDQVKKLLAGFIGRTEGFEIDLEIAGQPGAILTAFCKDSRVLDGAAFVVAGPRAAAIERALSGSDAGERVREYAARHRAAGERPRRRTGDEDELTSLDTGLRVRHPGGGPELPVLVSRAVDAQFATSVEIGNPGRSARDAEIARQHGLSATARGGALDPAGLRRAVHYRVHDWLVSRQRRWGTPIPILRCDACGDVAVPEAELPVLLLPAGATRPSSPCPRCGRLASMETDTLDCYFDVVWCFLACSSLLDESFRFRPEDLAPWSPVDWFHNGVDSFLYAHLYRFIGQVLHEMGILPQPEPIRSYHGHDAVLAEGRKMSKHHGTAVSPDALVDEVGADVLRVHLLWSASPLKKMEWSDVAVDKAARLLSTIWGAVAPRAEAIAAALRARPPGELPAPLGRVARRVTSFLESYRYTGCLEEIHLLAGRLARAAEELTGGDAAAVHRFAVEARTLVLLLAPFAPHVCEELWERIGGEGLVARAPWPAPPPAA